MLWLNTFGLMRLLVVTLLFLLGTCSGSDNRTVDFAPLRSRILLLLQQTPQSPCSMPKGAIMITYSNQHLFHLLVLQRRALEVNNVRSCVESRFVTVCLDAICLQLCDLHGIPNCIDLKIETEASDFMAKDYVWITYVKHEITEAAVQVATEVFFLDTDTLLFNDPWSVDLSVPDGPYDLRYQPENDAANGCASSANGGQIYVRQTNATMAYFTNIKAHKDEILDGHHGLDQGFMIPAAQAAHAKYCALDPAYFIGHCGGSRLSQADSEKIVVFHVNCVSGSQNKLDRLLHFYEVIKMEKKLKLDVTVGEADI